MDMFENYIITIQLIYWINKITKGVCTMTTQTLSTALMGVALILTLFSEKLFNNMKKSEK